MAKNNNLHAAKNAKNDEFYTQISDIEKEVKHYKDFFNGKVVYCNCDDPKESNFFKFFREKFLEYGLKKLITTGYKKDGHGVSYIIDKDVNGNKKIDEEEIIVTELQENGGYETEECIAFLKEADVVVTNPPFSLFRDYVKQLMDYNKKFLIIGNKNAITYKEIFPYIKNNQLWLGLNSPCDFSTPSGEITKTIAGLCRWFTNIENQKRTTPLDLYRKYNPTDYPKYDNYDAINVDKVTDIPEDYDGVMGVPITFLDKYCPNQFNIIGLLNSSDKELAGIEATREYDNFKEIRQDGTFTKSSGRKTKGNPVLKGKSKKGNYYIDPLTNECVFSTYARILVRKIK